MIQSEVRRMVGRITGVFDCDRVSGNVFTVAESRHTENAVAVGASGVSTERDGEQLQCAFLLVEVEALDAPKHLILVRRCRENHSRSRHDITYPERSDTGIPVYVDIYIEMTNFGDAVLRPLAAARAERIGSDVDIRAVVILIAQPGEIAWRKHLLQPNDALRRRRRVLLAEEHCNGLSGKEASG